MPSEPENLPDGWEWDNSSTVPTGVSVAVEMANGSTVRGELAAIWTFPGRATARRDRRSRRRRRRGRCRQSTAAGRARRPGRSRRLTHPEITVGFKSHPEEPRKQQAKLTDEPSENPRGPSTTESWQAGRRRLPRTRGFSGIWQKRFVQSGDAAPQDGTERCHHTPVRTVPTARDRDHHDHRMHASKHDHPKRKFIFSSCRAKLQEGGAPAPPTAGVAGRYLPIRQAKPEHSSGGEARGPPPASQHVAVSGGGETPHLTASCCEAGAGGLPRGGRDA